MNRAVTQLARPLAISLATHLAIGWLFFAEGLQHPRRAGATVLTVTLASREQSPVIPPVSAPPVPAAAAPEPPPATRASSGSGDITQKARFIVAPDLAALEEIPVTLSGRLHFRLHVSALGTVDRITLMKGDPVPKELADGMLLNLQRTRLTPALAGSEPVASTLDLIIGFEPGPAPLPMQK